jgi:hypothetical protein
MSIHRNGKHHQSLFIDEFKIKRSTKDDSVYQAVLDVTTFVQKPQNHEMAGTALTSTLSAKL